jgi:hypothetical protein
MHVSQCREGKADCRVLLFLTTDAKWQLDPRYSISDRGHLILRGRNRAR